ncbi:hypothetical protein BH09PSE5_BH09PSE5_25360 [soil metagenome]
MDTAELLANPMIATLSPEEVFHLLKRAQASAMQARGHANRSDVHGGAFHRDHSADLAARLGTRLSVESRA